MIRIALPNKGRLAEPARELLRRAGLTSSSLSTRALQAPLAEGFDAIFVRAADIPEFVADGAADVGITGRDLLAESGRSLVERADLEIGRCRLVVAGPESDPGDLVSTGSTLRTNRLREMETIMHSSAVLVSRTDVDPNHTMALSDLTEALTSVIRARDKRYLMANVPRERLEDVRRVVPGMSGPTIVELLDGGDMVAAHAVVDQAQTFRAIADLRALGAEGILVTPIERLVP